jgi:hypothetical protein
LLRRLGLAVRIVPPSPRAVVQSGSVGDRFGDKPSAHAVGIPQVPGRTCGVVASPAAAVRKR